MSITQTFDELADRLQHTAGSDTVFGDPIAAEGKTIIPVARIRYGFGGGFGSAEAGPDVESVAEEGDEERPIPAGEGGGMGGGVDATPVGVVEVTEDDTRFVRFADRRRLAAVFLSGLFLGGLLARRRRTER
ncbi:MAG: GerW family sporulation protein [Halapricum sp.]